MFAHTRKRVKSIWHEFQIIMANKKDLDLMLETFFSKWYKVQGVGSIEKKIQYSPSISLGFAENIYIGRVVNCCLLSTLRIKLQRKHR